MESLSSIVGALDDFFRLAESGIDPAFSRFLPATYESAPRSWQSWVEPTFSIHFNGLMLRGGATVQTVFLAVFPSAIVLEAFLARAEAGDVLFVFHPIDLKSGDPRGTWGNFWQPITDETIEALRAKQLSIYSCHAPLGCHPTVGSSRAIATALGGTVTGQFFLYGPGYAGVIAKILTASFDGLEERLRRIFGVPYLDTAGAKPATIETIAIVSGSGDRVEEMEHAEAAGADAYITGEIHSRIDTEYGHRKFANVERFAATTRMALLGVSHAASEFLVMEREMPSWFKQRFAVGTVPLREAHWWR
jgi:putative NIF3 family GTP cyclohydrolase 1 type 2